MYRFRKGIALLVDYLVAFRYCIIAFLLSRLHPGIEFVLGDLSLVERQLEVSDGLIVFRGGLRLLGALGIDQLGELGKLFGSIAYRRHRFVVLRLRCFELSDLLVVELLAFLVFGLRLVECRARFLKRFLAFGNLFFHLVDLFTAALYLLFGVFQLLFAIGELFFGIGKLLLAVIDGFLQLIMQIRKARVRPIRSD